MRPPAPAVGREERGAANGGKRAAQEETQHGGSAGRHPGNGEEGARAGGGLSRRLGCPSPAASSSGQRRQGHDAELFGLRHS